MGEPGVYGSSFVEAEAVSISTLKNIARVRDGLEDSEFAEASIRKLESNDLSTCIYRAVEKDSNESGSFWTLLVSFHIHPKDIEDKRKVGVLLGGAKC